MRQKKKKKISCYFCGLVGARRDILTHAKKCPTKALWPLCQGVQELKVSERGSDGSPKRRRINVYHQLILNRDH